MKRKGMHQRRKLVLLAVLLIMVGIAVWRIWQTPRPTVLHRQDAWLSSAEPEMVAILLLRLSLLAFILLTCV